MAETAAIGRNVFRCNRCDTSGGMLDLYAKLYGISTSEANRQIREAMNMGQNREDYEIHNTYSCLLSMLLLSKKHQEDLLARGVFME